LTRPAPRDQLLQRAEQRLDLEVVRRLEHRDQVALVRHAAPRVDVLEDVCERVCARHLRELHRLLLVRPLWAGKELVQVVRRRRQHVAVGRV